MHMTPTTEEAVLKAKTVVDDLIAERAPRLSQTRLGRLLLTRFLHPLLDYPKAVEALAAVQHKGGHAIFAHAAEMLRQRLVVSGLEHLPASGPVIIVSNHPTGLADGIALRKALGDVRPDLWFLANADALRLNPRLDEIIVPVEWVRDKRSHAKTRAMLAATAQVIRRDQALIIFPSGRLSYMTWRGLTERPWQPTVIALARKFGVPIVPVRMLARNSAIFYLFSQISTELRDITLFHELLNKRDRLFQIELAPAIRPEELPRDPLQAARRLQRYVESGMRDRSILEARPAPGERLGMAAARSLPTF
ncbi:Putative hemolysin [Arboricoccus pini]|uniref:Putative hemolysin n=2 Tax=Arboricoccus pini TaxID=1963835 RepID=A0A212QY67_9PROT|nr:Putative hemolysin [Arboricoccus pini]